MFRIRRYTESDCGEILQVFYETIHASNGGDYSPAQLDAWAPRPETMDAEDWNRRLLRDCTWVAEADPPDEKGKRLLLGFANLGPGEHIPQAEAFCPMEDIGYLDCLYVLREAQRNGIAARLERALTEEAFRRGKTQMFAEVSITARPFFEAGGYEVLREQKVFLRGETFINFLMRKRLLDGTKSRTPV